MPATYTDQFWIIDPYAPPAAGTTLTVQKYEMVDQDDDGDIGGDSTGSTPDTINGLDVSRAYPGDTITVDLAGGGTTTITGTTFYLSDGSQVFTPTDGSVLEESNLVSTTYVSSTGDLDVSDLGPPCLVKGTQVDTPMGLIPVENLKSGMSVLGQDGQHLTLCMVLSTEISATGLAQNPKLQPICIVSGALGNGLPKRDLKVSRQHRMLVNTSVVSRMFDQPEVLVPAIRLTSLPGIYVDTSETPVTYYHLVFNQHEIIFAEGAATESLYTGPEALKSISPEARRELFALFPDLKRRPKNDIAAARVIPSDSRQKALVKRLAKNQQPVQK
ncbi:MAG: Hint domain-containing protein [Cognatishimia sp.]